jgi:hypothetical protein
VFWGEINKKKGQSQLVLPAAQTKTDKLHSSRKPKLSVISLLHVSAAFVCYK